MYLRFVFMCQGILHFIWHACLDTKVSCFYHVMLLCSAVMCCHISVRLSVCHACGLRQNNWTCQFKWWLFLPTDSKKSNSLLIRAIADDL